jgi:hypothetical protein
MKEVVLLIIAAIFISSSSVFAQGKLLKPVRSNVELDNYQIDIAEAKNKKDSQDRVALSLRVMDKNKKLIKPLKVYLISGSDTAKPLNRKDHWSSENVSGLPVSSAVNTSGGASFGINLTSLASSKGNYTYTVLEFGSKDFNAGASLKVVLPDKKELVILLTSIAE